MHWKFATPQVDIIVRHDIWPYVMSTDFKIEKVDIARVNAPHTYGYLSGG